MADGSLGRRTRQERRRRGLLVHTVCGSSHSAGRRAGDGRWREESTLAVGEDRPPDRRQRAARAAELVGQEPDHDLEGDPPGREVDPGQRHPGAQVRPGQLPPGLEVRRRMGMGRAQAPSCARAIPSHCGATG